MFAAQFHNLAYSPLCASLLDFARARSQALSCFARLSGRSSAQIFLRWIVRPRRVYEALESPRQCGFSRYQHLDVFGPDTGIQLINVDNGCE